jgi:hypothetical protein
MAFEPPMVDLLVEALLAKQQALLRLIERGDDVPEARLDAAMRDLEEAFAAVQLALPEPPSDAELLSELTRAQRMASFLVYKLGERRAELMTRAELAARAREAVRMQPPPPTGDSCDMRG